MSQFSLSGLPTQLMSALWALVIMILLPALTLAAPAPVTPPVIAHRLNVQIDPASGTLNVQDQMGLPDAESEWLLVLHDGLNPRVTSGNAELSPAGQSGHLAGYRLRRHAPGSMTLSYSGTIQHDLETLDEGMGRTRQWSRGSINADGVVLDGNSGWYPRLPGTLQTMQLEVQLPVGWTAVSQGAGPGDTTSGLSRWSENQPQDDLYLIAAPFSVYRQTADGVEAQVYLRTPDPALAKRYLDATQVYLRHDSELIGAYPYAKFALVENLWETGYGMPSLTLLGSQVIRLPFIIESSYPHEILHNWWGNSVYVADEGGNWSEGLTNDLADHWMQEQRGQGAAYRRDILKGFADFVRSDQDFPLSAFRGRHGEASQAIGYGKGAMVFHMLKQQLGETAFNMGLRRFYADNRFRYASYRDLETAFETVSGDDLSAFFDAWITRTGAPRLALHDVQVVHQADGDQVSGQILQTQDGAPFPLQIPVVIEQSEGAPVRLQVASNAAATAFSVTLPSAPTRLSVDPDFDVFRELVPGETPVTLSALFGAERGLILLPATASKELQSGYRQLAEAWQSGRPAWEIRLDSDVSALPDDRPVWLLGWENRHLERFAADAVDFRLDTATHQIQLQDSTRMDADSTVLTRSTPQAFAWLAAQDAAALPVLARKLPHYGKYSYLRFSGASATNQLKGQWPAADSSLTYQFRR